ncbi:hypothetical protein RND81_07G197500 [Saponaria officinalis]|uniref:F-box domain-containing protein n=1 Tax=Saponaria officinalis TaxID=3572 RepID=A0AAW1JQC8_SAPOF
MRFKPIERNIICIDGSSGGCTKEHPGSQDTRNREKNCTICTELVCISSRDAIKKVVGHHKKGKGHRKKKILDPPLDGSPKLIQRQPIVEIQKEVFLPKDIVFEILLRLPVRHLLRVRCVCKSWCAIIDDPNFMMRHHRTQISICEAHYGDIPIISIAPYAIAEDNSLICFCVALLSKQNGDVDINMKPDLVRDTAGYFAPGPDFGLGLLDGGDLVNITNGIVCLCWDNNLGLWNPATREFKAIPPWREPCSVFIKGCYFDFFGFGFDSISNDFKIVRVIRYQDDVFGGYEVYSLTTSSWKKRLEDVPPSIYSLRNRSSVSAYLNGVCYWFFDETDVEVIVSFNFSTEVFKVFNPPHNVVGSKTGYEYKRVLTLYKDRLALVVSRFDMVKAMSSFDVWVVTEFEDDSKIPVSWQHLLTIGPLSSSDGLTFSAFGMDGDVLLTKEPDDDDLSGYSSLYNPSTGTLKRLDSCLYNYYRYVESLFPLYDKLVRS